MLLKSTGSLRRKRAENSPVWRTRNRWKEQQRHNESFVGDSAVIDYTSSRKHLKIIPESSSGPFCI